MNVQTDAMTGPMKVSLHAPIDQAGLVAGLFEPVANSTMDLHAIRAVFDLGNGFFLGILHRLIELFQFGAWSASDDRSRHVGEIPRGRRPWEHIEDDAPMRRQRPAPFVMRITRLLAA